MCVFCDNHVKSKHFHIQRKVDMGAFVFGPIGDECFVFLTCLFLEFYDALHE